MKHTDKCKRLGEDAMRMSGALPHDEVTAELKKAIVAYVQSRKIASVHDFTHMIASLTLAAGLPIEHLVAASSEIKYAYVKAEEKWAMDQNRNQVH